MPGSVPVFKTPPASFDFLKYFPQILRNQKFSATINMNIILNLFPPKSSRRPYSPAA